MIKKISLIVATCLLATVSLAAAEALKVDAKLPKYKSTAGVSGNLNSIGSDTLNNLMTMWAEGFHKKYPNVNLQIEGKGSSTAPPALIAGTAQFGPMSREMKSSEIDQLEKKYGFKPTKVGVALDSLAVFVNKDNPVKSLSLDKVDAAFSKTRKRGHSTDITTWDQLGVTGKLAKQPISLYGRNSASGTYGYFKEHTLAKGDYKDTVKEQPGSASVVQGVTKDRNGMGYSGIGYRTSGVKAIALAEKDGAEAYAPNYENVLSGKYPLGRMLYIYVVKEPNKPLPPVQAEFLKFILSKEGQEIVVKDGFLPLPKKVVDQQLKAL
ncbi:PstS family phosphate ABC transporter substrate-binding protein [Geobacter argillaceus]|uniref:Phosphate-binding protein n=1 Tax=Geobacter argillaceus TaxID=345631 RepID=A0A562VG28_9BACT|nr:PstS family phosphate ABC transporter substrate-binding protein [Geobacter argillaceus]TWJ16876.1 phosphate ABC transporter substrate-binding protein (PhoT family) [Geobacter argillaceus]